MTAHPARRARHGTRTRTGPCTRGRPLAGEHPGRARSAAQGRPDCAAGVREARPGSRRAVHDRLRLHSGRPVPDTLLLRGRQATVPCLAIRRGPRARFTGEVFQAAAREDLDRLARGTGGTGSRATGRPCRCARDPSGIPVRVVHAGPNCRRCPGGARHRLDFGPVAARVERPAAARCPGPRRSSGWATWCLGATRFRAAPGLVPGHARADRQRFPVPGRAARTRPGDGLCPL